MAQHNEPVQGGSARNSDGAFGRSDGRIGQGWSPSPPS